MTKFVRVKWLTDHPGRNCFRLTVAASVLINCGNEALSRAVSIA